MAYRAKTYTLREEITEDSTRYFISFKGGQGDGTVKSYAQISLQSLAE